MAAVAVTSHEPLIMLDAYAARSCPVKTQNAFDPRLADWTPAQISTTREESAAVELFDGGLAWKTLVLDAWVAAGAVDLRTAPDAAARGRAAAAGGAPVIIALPLSDPDGHRTGRPDVLVRGADTPQGRPGYHPVVVKWHKITERVRPAREDRPPRVVRTTLLAAPAPAEATVRDNLGLRVGRRQGDFLQLAHYHRMLEAIGLAPKGPAMAAVVGTDDRDDPFLAWIDLAEPLVRTFSRTEADGWRLRSLLERYDHEQDFRVDVAARARAQAYADPPPLLVAPVVNDECLRCPWWQHCRPLLDADDLSLRIDKGPLDSREIVVLRRFGIRTLTDLADADLLGLSTSYLPEVTHRAGAENRLQIAARRAKMLLTGRAFERETSGPIEVRAAAVEIDLDVESSADGRIYLWGFLVDDGRGEPVCHQFGRFAELDEGSEIELAVEALTWLRDLVEASPSALAYHYSGYETAVIRGLAERSRDPALIWTLAWLEHGFVDLLDVVKENFFGASGLGLKAIAGAAGFTWRDPDPNGLSSQLWFAEAVVAAEPERREAARQRVLEYNEDDVIATHRLRAWLRDH